jgi:periplasmic divalent cation tolerance protein
MKIKLAQMRARTCTSISVRVQEKNRRIEMVFAESGCVLVLTTVAESEDGRALASKLVGEGLAACVNILGGMDSVYQWKGAVEEARERQIVIKTTSDRIPELDARLRQLHPYELPEFIVVSVAAGSAQYLTWIRESTAKAG